MRIVLLLPIAIVIGLGSSVAGVRPLAAQGTPEPPLARAVAMLDATEPERAIELLRQLLLGLPPAAPSALRSEAHLRLAAASWSLGFLDSAAAHFQAAVREDAFLRLDPDVYNPELVLAFRASRRAIVAVGVRPPPDTLLDTRTGRWPVAVAVSQPGQVRLRLVPSGGAGGERPPTVLVVDSSATVSFPVAAADGVELASGQYRLVVEYAGSAGAAARSEASLEVAQSTADTLVYEAPPPDSLFRLEFRWGPRSRGTLLRGVGVGVGAAAIPLLLGQNQLRTSGTTSRALLVGATVSVAGLAAYFFGRPRQRLPENIEYNRALRSAWEERNRSIAATNAARRGALMLRVRVVREP